jgi:hypothetical protein
LSFQQGRLGILRLIIYDLDQMVVGFLFNMTARSLAPSCNTPSCSFGSRAHTVVLQQNSYRAAVMFYCRKKTMRCWRHGFECVTSTSYKNICGVFEFLEQRRTTGHDQACRLFFSLCILQRRYWCKKEAYHEK